MGNGGFVGCSIDDGFLLLLQHLKVGAVEQFKEGIVVFLDQGNDRALQGGGHGGFASGNVGVRNDAQSVFSSLDGLLLKFSEHFLLRVFLEHGLKQVVYFTEFVSLEQV